MSGTPQALPSPVTPSVPTGPNENEKIFSRDEIADMLVAKYESKKGVKEVTVNTSPEIIEFQRAVDGVASKEAWCMAFMQWGAISLCKDLGIKCPVYPSETVNSVFDGTKDKKYISKLPKRGSWFIQKNFFNYLGHTGCCKNATVPKFNTIEGNTNAKGSRDGDGVYDSWQLITGTATRTNRGFIDVPQMIWDALYITPGVKPPNAPQPTTNTQSDWGVNLDGEIMAMVSPSLLGLTPGVMSKFMPAWASMNQEQRRRFFADLLFAMALPESNYKATTMFLEPGGDTDRVTGLPLVSEGLLQLSYADTRGYPGLPFDFEKDAVKFREDWNARNGQKSWYSKYPERTILNPVNNVKAAMIIITTLLAKYPSTEFADVLGKYWSTMRRYKKGTKTYNDSFLKVCKTLKQKGYQT